MKRGKSDGESVAVCRNFDGLGVGVVSGQGRGRERRAADDAPGRLWGMSELRRHRRNLVVRKAPGRRSLLHFGAVDFRCQVLIGHAEVTDVPHEGGLVPFTVDVTDFAKDGDNELILCVWDPTRCSLGSCGKQVENPSGYKVVTDVRPCRGDEYPECDAVEPGIAEPLFVHRTVRTG